MGCDTYLQAWTGADKGPDPDCLKNTGQINTILLKGKASNDTQKKQAQKTYSKLTLEIHNARKKVGKPLKGPAFRSIHLDPSKLNAMTVGSTYFAPCFEAYSKKKLSSGNGVPSGSNVRLTLKDNVPGVDLSKINTHQAEILVHPGTGFKVISLTAQTHYTEIELEYTGTLMKDLNNATLLGEVFFK